MEFDECVCNMQQTKKKDTRSATTNFDKEEVLKVFDRNTRMIPFIMFSDGAFYLPLKFVH